jgi:ribulose-5-phosphate 4-epimerase/fuculose-1-phosphate aldolase
MQPAPPRNAEALAGHATGDPQRSVYEPDQPGLTFPQRPHFDDVADERRYRQHHLVAACRAFAQHGYDYGFAGHLTVRDPEHPDRYWTNPMAVHFAQVRVSNLVLANHAGDVVQGTHALNRAGFVLHAAVHAAHPDIVAMCHAHTIHGTAFAALGRAIEPISQDAAVFFEDHVVIGAEGGKVAVSTQAGHAFAAAFRGVKAAVHQNHGLITASRHSIDAAAFWFIGLERVCRQQLLVAATGLAPQLVPPDKARYSREHVGSEYIGWLHFQPLYDHLAATQPDMFD